jgi:hypothetical protein
MDLPPAHVSQLRSQKLGLSVLQSQISSYNDSKHECVIKINFDRLEAPGSALFSERTDLAGRNPLADAQRDANDLICTIISEFGVECRCEMDPTMGRCRYEVY